MKGEFKFTSLIDHINIFNPFLHQWNCIKYSYKFFFSPNKAIKITDKNNIPAVTNGKRNPNSETIYPAETEPKRFPIT